MKYYLALAFIVFVVLLAIGNEYRAHKRRRRYSHNYEQYKRFTKRD